MLCPDCGKEVPDHSRFCLICGKSLEPVVDLSNRRSEPNQPTTPQVTVTVPTEALERDSGASAAHNPPGKTPTWRLVVGWTLIVIGVLGELSNIDKRSGGAFLSSLPTALFIITLGIALIRRWSSKQIGITLGSIFLVMVIVAIMLPKLNRSQMYAHETAAIKEIQTLNTAQAQYKSKFGRFAQSLSELGPPAVGEATAYAADLISADLASGEKDGYV